MSPDTCSMQLPEADRGASLMNSQLRRASGSLNVAEEEEAESYLHIGSLLAVMQSRARRFLSKTGSVGEVTRELLRRIRNRAGALRILPDFPVRFSPCRFRLTISSLKSMADRQSKETLRLLARIGTDSKDRISLVLTSRLASSSGCSTRATIFGPTTFD